MEDAYRLGDFAGAVTLLVEGQEDATVARILAPEGAALRVGVPIAVLAERSGDDGDSDAAAAVKRAQAYKVPTDDVYSASAPKVRVLEWQSYLKASKEDSGGKKCMG